MRTLIALTLAAIACVACAGTPPPTAQAAPTATRRVGLALEPGRPGDTEYVLNHDSVLRRYVLHAPPGANPLTAYPVVVMLWDNGSPDAAIAQSGWSEKADVEGFIVAYGQADRGVWNDGSPPGEAGRVKGGDVGYIGALFTDVARHFTVDSKRLHVAGYGSGGSVAWIAAGERSGQVGSTAAVGGHLYPSTLNIDKGSSFLYIVGTQDPQYPLNGGPASDSSGTMTNRPPIQQTFDRWLLLMKCRLSAEPVSNADGVKVFAYRGCRDGAESYLQTVDGMGHQWPGGPRPAGIVSRDKIDAASVMWEFFKKHPRA